MVTQSLATGRRAEACGRRERGLVWLGTGVIALHIVDDSFVQPQPGTSATDHLAGGLVPLALLGLAAFAYPRLRAGWRAVVALLLGVFGLGTASEAWYYTREVGASGDDYTGLLAIPAGLMLLACRGGDALAVQASRRADAAPLRASRPARRGEPGRRRGGRLPARLLLRTDAHRPRGRAARPSWAPRRRRSPSRPTTGWSSRAGTCPRSNRAAVIAFPGRKGPQRPARMLDPPRLRRAAVRPPRRGRERRRSERGRLERRPGHQGRDRVPAQAARRGPRAHRRDRALRRRRADARDRGGDGRS